MHLFQLLPAAFALTSVIGASVLPRQNPDSPKPVPCSGAGSVACSDRSQGTLRRGDGKCIAQAAAESGITSFCAIDRCPYGKGLRSVQSSGRSGSYNACQACNADEAFSYDGNKACRVVPTGSIPNPAFTFECERLFQGDRFKASCDRGNQAVSSANPNGYGLCIVPAGPIDAAWAAGKDFIVSPGDNVGAGYCAYTTCKEGFKAVPAAFRLGLNGAGPYTACVPNEA